MARRKRPTVPPQVSSYIVDSYVRLRKHSKEKEQQHKAYTHTSARTLLGVLRLSQALARLRFSDMVEHADVDEALRLMEISAESLKDDDDEMERGDSTIKSKIFRIIRDMFTAAQSGIQHRTRSRGRLGKGPSGERDMDVDDEDEDDRNELSMVDVRNRILAAGFTESQLADCIQEVCHFKLSKSRKDTIINFITVRGYRRLDKSGKQYQTVLHQCVMKIYTDLCFPSFVPIEPAILRAFFWL